MGRKFDLKSNSQLVMKGCAQWCYGTRSSCRYRAVSSVLSIFFLGGLYAFFHGVNTVVLDMVSFCCPLAVGAEAKFVGSF